MSRIYIAECKCGVSKGGFACGPVEGSVNAAVKFTVDGVSKWLTNSEFTGIPNFYLTDESVFERFMDDDLTDEFGEYLDPHYLKEFEGIFLAGEYDMIVKSLEENENNPASALIRFVIALTRCDNEEIESLIRMGTGHYVEELDIPLSDVEEEIMDLW